MLQHAGTPLPLGQASPRGGACQLRGRGGACTSTPPSPSTGSSGPLRSRTSPASDPPSHGGTARGEGEGRGGSPCHSVTVHVRSEQGPGRGGLGEGLGPSRWRAPSQSKCAPRRTPALPRPPSPSAHGTWTQALRAPRGRCAWVQRVCLRKGLEWLSARHPPRTLFRGNSADPPPPPLGGNRHLAQKA